MATKVITSYDLETGDTESAAIDEVGDLVIHATVILNTNGKQVRLVPVAKEGDASYTPVCDKAQIPIELFINGNGMVRAKISGIDAEHVKIYVFANGADGALTIETTKSDKTTT